MNLAPLHAYLAQELRRAGVSFRLDEELGTHHGISWSDFMLLQLLDDASVAVPEQELARRLGLLGSRLLMRLRPLEKLGLLARTVDERDRRAVRLSAAGRGLLREARETAASVCAQAGAAA